MEKSDKSFSTFLQTLYRHFGEPVIIAMQINYEECEFLLGGIKCLSISALVEDRMHRAVLGIIGINKLHHIA